MFNESKATQMAAYLLKKAECCTLPHLKLMKLLYLAERTAYLEHGYGISDDTLVSMPYGPVLSSTLNLMNGEPGRERVWQADRKSLIKFGCSLRILTSLICLIIRMTQKTAQNGRIRTDLRIRLI